MSLGLLSIIPRELLPVVASLSPGSSLLALRDAGLIDAACFQRETYEVCCVTLRSRALRFCEDCEYLFVSEVLGAVRALDFKARVEMSVSHAMLSSACPVRYRATISVLSELVCTPRSRVGDVMASLVTSCAGRMAPLRVIHNSWCRAGVISFGCEYMHEVSAQYAQDRRSLGEYLHSYCEDGEECCPRPRHFSSLQRLTSFPTEQEFDAIPGQERVLFHGTRQCYADAIMHEGFRPELCEDSSFGKGIYMSSCCHMASGFTGGDGLVFVCRVKLGVTREFAEYDPEYVRQEQHSNHCTYCFNEYVLYEGARILPVAIARCVL